MNDIVEFDLDQDTKEKLFHIREQDEYLYVTRVEYKNVVYTLREFVAILKEHGGVISDGTLKIFKVKEGE